MLSVFLESRNLWEWLSMVNPSVEQWRECLEVNFVSEVFPCNLICKSWPETVMGLYCWTFERIKTGKIVWSRGTVAWDMLQNQITMGKPVVGGSESPFRTKAHPTSSWSAPIITNTSQLSFIQQGKNKNKLWELSIRVAVSVFLFGTRGPPGLCLWSRNPIMIIDCVHNLCFDRLADGSCGILCQPLSGSPESFLSETSRQQGMLKLFRFKWSWNEFRCRMQIGIKIQFATQLIYSESSDFYVSTILSKS